MSIKPSRKDFYAVTKGRELHLYVVPVALEGALIDLTINLPEYRDSIIARRHDMVFLFTPANGVGVHLALNLGAQVDYMGCKTDWSYNWLTSVMPNLYK